MFLLHGTQVMVTERVPEPLIKQGEGGGGELRISSIVIQFQQFSDFLKAYKETFQRMCLNPKNLGAIKY